LVLIGLLIFLAIPVVHLVRTSLREDEARPSTPRGFVNDASGLSLTPVDTVVDVTPDRGQVVAQLQAVLAHARQHQLPVSIAGARHSMGGHTMHPGGLVLNLRPYRFLELDTAANLLTVGAGALWQEALDYLDRRGKSVAVMQAFSSFTVGGSLSVNGHGWQKNTPPIGSSVVAFTLLDAQGKLWNCSRTENQELFGLVLGGYGLFGVILDVKLRVVDNETYHFHQYRCSPAEYLAYFKKYAADDARVKLVFGRLNVSDKQFLEKGTLNVFLAANQPLPTTKPEPNQSLTELKRLVFRGTVNNEYGKRLRWDLETSAAALMNGAVFTRNEVLNEDASLIENKDTTSTDILQEYFIPERHFVAFIDGLKQVLPNPQIDLLNITIRDVYRDSDSYLRYAHENVYGFVFLFNQKKNGAHEAAMQALTQQLVDLALRSEGTYYLPYRLHVDRATMRRAYPQADQFFALKRKYDPQEVFRSKFYEHYK
jgi:FAD/FMN-containing dehydrogenase